MRHQQGDARGRHEDRSPSPLQDAKYTLFGDLVQRDDGGVPTPVWGARDGEHWILAAAADGPAEAARVRNRPEGGARRALRRSRQASGVRGGGVAAVLAGGGGG